MDPDRPLGASRLPDTPEARSAREALAEAIERQKRARNEAQEQQIAAARTALAAKNPIPSGMTADEYLAIAAARATAAADAPLGSMGSRLGRSLPAALRRMAGLEVVNPKIWRADVKPLRGRKINVEAFLSRARVAARRREKGDVREPTIVRVAELLVWAIRRESSGFARLTFEQLAGMVRICRETTRKAIRFLERHGVIDTFNVLSRDHGQVRRQANLYLIPDAEDRAEPTAEAGLAARLNRWASAFGLIPRVWGLNATPAPVGYRPVSKRPAPA